MVDFVWSNGITMRRRDVEYIESLLWDSKENLQTARASITWRWGPTYALQMTGSSGNPRHGEPTSLK